MACPRGLEPPTFRSATRWWRSLRVPRRHLAWPPEHEPTPSRSRPSLVVTAFHRAFVVRLVVRTPRRLGSALPERASPRLSFARKGSAKRPPWWFEASLLFRHSRSQ